MGVLNWLSGLFGDKNTLNINGECFFDLGVDYFYKRLAVESTVNLIANSITRCEFQTFKRGKKVRGNNYYLLNVEPNANENATQFMKKLVSKLLTENECLVIMQNEQLIVADDFNVKTFVLKENIYTDVKVGDLQFSKTFMESEVLYFKLNNNDVKSVINGLFESHGKLISSAMNYYKRKNNKRFAIMGDFLRAQDTETQKAIDGMFENQLKNWFDPDKEGVAFQLQKDFALTDMSDGQKAGTNNTSRDINDLVNDMINYVAMAYNVPPGILKGDVVDVEKQTDNFLMFCINPLAKLISDEFNRKMYTKQEYLERTYLKIDTSKIKVIDLTKIATAVDKLFAVGGLSINDILEMLGFEPIDEDWANKRYVTKNYERADMSESLKGGET